MLSASLNQPVATTASRHCLGTTCLPHLHAAPFQTASSITGLSANESTLRFAEPGFNFGK